MKKIRKEKETTKVLIKIHDCNEQIKQWGEEGGQPKDNQERLRKGCKKSYWIFSYFAEFWCIITYAW